MDRGNWKIRLSQKLHIPAGIGAGLPCIMLYGSSECVMDRHRGIVAYDPERIVVALSSGNVCLEGEKLELCQMHREGLLIRGVIQSVSFEKGAG